MDKKYYVIGLGGYGSKLAEELSLKMKKDGASVISLAFDTDHSEIEGRNCDYNFDLSCQGDFSTVVTDLLKKKIKVFDDPDAIELNYAKCLLMDRGASLWRLKAYISFINFMSINDNKKRLDNLIEEIAFNPSVESEFYFVGSLAGGTSSALALPISLYIKKYFRELNYRKFKTIFFASTPDIFALSLNAELKTKVFANAYATLSEINTVNLITTKHLNKKFIIGKETMPFGVLFDGTSQEYNFKACAPFNDVVLFDRMPSTTSVDTFRSTVESYIFYYYKGLIELEKNKEFDDVGIYSSFTVSELNYNLENNLDYVSRLITNKKIKEEFSKAYHSFKNTTSIKAIGGDSKEQYSTTEKFTITVADYVESLKGESLDRTCILLNRDETYNFGGEIEKDNDVSRYYEEIEKYFYNLINEDEKYSQLKNKLEKYYFTKKEENKINFNSKGKKGKLIEFTNYYEELFKELNSVVNNLIGNYFNNIEFENLIFENTDLSIEKIIKVDDNFIHPTLALFKLSQLFNFISDKKRNYLELEESEIHEAIIYNKISDKIFNFYRVHRGNKGYSRLSNTRLVDTFTKKSQIKKILKIKDKNNYLFKYPKFEEKYLISDFKCAMQNAFNNLLGIFISKITNSIEKLINNYCEFYNNLNFIDRKIQNEIGDLEYSDNSSNGFFEIRANKEDRINDANNFIYEIKKGNYTNIDSGYGKAIFEFAKGFNSEKANSQFKEIANDLCAIERDNLKDTKYYQQLLLKNVLSAMCEPTTKNYSKSILSRATKIRPSFVTNNKPNEIDKRTLHLSKDVAEYILSNAKNLLIRETNLELAVEELLSNIGEYETAVIVNDNLSSNEAFIVAEKSGVNLSNIIKIKCDDGVSLYKAEYDKAVKNKSDYYSEMWNPHVFLLNGETELYDI
ncbi:MAG: hypothetical protein IKA85_03845 [Clostridia bacterium]|nr:hypothetical protein [Clostridia bacterium]